MRKRPAGLFEIITLQVYIFTACIIAQPSFATARPITETRLIKVAAAQILTGYNLEENQRKIITAMEDAHDSGCKIVLFHEGCLTGYPDLEQLKETDFAKVREIEREIRDLAGSLHIAVLLGSSGEKNGVYENYLLVINEEGNVLGKYRKTWRAGEPYYSPGQGPVVFTVAGVEATAIICHDLRYPELTRLGVAAGAQIIFIANNESGILREDKLLGYRSMQISRATESHVFAVMSNCPADPGDVGRRNASHGNSSIIDPLGNVLDEASVFEERLVTAEIDLSRASRSTVTRTLGSNTNTNTLYWERPDRGRLSGWFREGLELVRRLDGTRVSSYLIN